jgi:hypothetical protein
MSDVTDVPVELLSNIRLRITDHNIQKKSIKSICAVAFESNEIRTTLGNAGGIQFILDVLNLRDMDVNDYDMKCEIINSSFLALCYLCLVHENIIRFNKNDGIAVILKIMQEYQNEYLIQNSAICLIDTICADPQNIIAIGIREGINYISRALYTYGTDVDFTKDALIALQQFSNNVHIPKRDAAVLKICMICGDVVDVILNVMKLHVGCRDVQIKSLETLFQLSVYDDDLENSLGNYWEEHQLKAITFVQITKLKCYESDVSLYISRLPIEVVDLISTEVMQVKTRRRFEQNKIHIEYVSVITDVLRTFNTDMKIASIICSILINTYKKNNENIPLILGPETILRLQNALKVMARRASRLNMPRLMTQAEIAIKHLLRNTQGRLQVLY